ncbi:LysR family transcriptional regulator [Paraburkholderia sp. BR10882]|uniref:LysR family transcriptional regulator n=1 Tax=unclassified Paraburkholderia TaxID=2615204 RepID=UPI0034CE4463
MNFDEEGQRQATMSLRQLEIFRTVMIAGSISEAARLLFIAQPSVTRILQLTEQRLGFLLFERIRGRLHPTPEAKRIYEEVESAYSGVQRVNDLVRALVEGRSGKLNVVCSPSLGVHLIPRAIAEFNRRFPGLQIHFEPLTHNNLIPRILFGQNYLAVSMFDIAHPNLVVEPLARVPIVVAAPRSTFGQKRFVGLDDLAGHAWIDYPHDTPLGKVVEDALDGAERPVPIVEVRSAISACQLALEGVGIALVDPFCASDALRSGLDVKPLRPEKRLQVSAVYSHAEPLSHSAREFLEILRQVFADYPA